MEVRSVSATWSSEAKQADERSIETQWPTSKQSTIILCLLHFLVRRNGQQTSIEHISRGQNKHLE